MTIRHIIFDCDGVLIDSEEISMEIDRRLLAENGVHISEGEMHQRFVGKTFAAMVSEVEAQTGQPLPTDLEARKDVLMLEVYRKELKPIAGVREALAAITLPKSIGTNGPRARAMEALSIVGIKQHFGERMTTFEDVKNGKPAPDIYLLAAERAGFAPGQCAVVEDSVTGVAAAVAAGCVTFGFTGSQVHRSEHALKLVELGATAVFDDMAQLTGLITKFG
ncbi:HAD family hydrolase [Aestuariivirga sp.]|uniref:HAD family hydrolase n=1 Tax=Aestuariivirga sp. TaxID=2650926 RepID=UPI0039E4DCE9